VHPIYYVPAGDVIPVFFSTYDGGTGASVTLTGLAVTDVEIYKDGSTTQRASDAGYTLLDTDGIDFDGTTGIHGFSIDTGDNTDASFYTTGAWFTVVVSSVTVDGQTVNFIACQFRIMAAESSAGAPKADVSHFGGTAGTFSSGRPEVNASHAAGTAWNSGAIGAATLASDTIAAAKIATGALTAAKFAAGAIDAAALAADAGTEIGTAVWATAARTLTAATNITSTGGTTVPQTGDSFARIGAAGAGLTAIDLPDQTMNITGNITGNVSGSVGSVTGNVGGNVTGSVGSVATGGIAAASFAAGAIDNAAIAASAIGASEIAADAITAAKIATGAIDADALAADAVDAILDETIGDGSITMRQALRVTVAALAGKLSGAATTTVTIRNTADSADVVVATVDANGNRTAVTLTP
jgi:hypothetical protein